MNLLIVGEQILLRLAGQFRAKSIDVDILATQATLAQLQAEAPDFNGVVIRYTGYRPEPSGGRVDHIQSWVTWNVTWNTAQLADGKVRNEGELAGETYKALTDEFYLTSPAPDADEWHLKLTTLDPASSPEMDEGPGVTYFPLRWTTRVMLCK